MFFKSHLLESDFTSPVTTWARAWRGVGHFQCRMSVILEEESRNWGPTPGLHLSFMRNQGPLSTSKEGAWGVRGLYALQGLEACLPSGLWPWNAGTVLPVRWLPAPWLDHIGALATDP